MTVRLFDKDSFMFEFEAEVLSCEKSENGYYITELDETAFFPEGGGQPGDRGFIGETEIFDTKIENGIIYHYSKAPVAAVKKIKCKIDRATRFDRMQNHTGEHIVSGTVHSHFGFKNVGFHLSDDEMTMDYNGELSAQDIEKIELLANAAVYDDLKVEALYPSPEELKSIAYRSKLELTDNIRIVTIKGVDCCACCAPHVKSTGMVGIIKITDFMRYKGGTRVFAACGARAFKILGQYQKSVEKISSLLSAKRDGVFPAAERILLESEEKSRKIVSLKKQLTDCRAENSLPVNGVICEFFDDADMNEMRAFANTAVKKCEKCCAVFSGNDQIGYKYVIESKNDNMREKASVINGALNGRGGGNEKMISGSCKAAKFDILEFFRSEY